MLISPISTVKAVPSFASRRRMGQEDSNRNFDEQFIPPKHSYTQLTKQHILQRLGIGEIHINKVSPKDRTYDSFTGLRDKNYLLASLDIAMKIAQESNNPLSVAMFDMDDFKSVNELLGYKTGDEFIKEISKDIAETAKEYDIDAYRFGGEEFVLIFDNQTSTQKKLLQRLLPKK